MKPEHRWGKNGNGYSGCPYFYSAIEKYGWDNFEHEIIKTGLTLEEANALESSLISEYDSMNPKRGYNLQSGGDNYEFSEIALKNISAAQKKRFESPEERRKLSNCMGGKHHSDKTKQKLSNIHLNKTQPNSILTDQYSINGEFIKTWRSRRNAAKCLGINTSDIYECCNGIQKTAGGFIWRNHSDLLTEEYLEWCTSYGDPKKVVQISNDTGEIIRVWKSISDIEKNLNIPSSYIYKCCNGKRSVSNDYIWMYEKDATESNIEIALNRVGKRKAMSNETKRKISKKNSKPIDQYTIDGDFIQTWESMSEASRKLGIGMSHIVQCCKGQRNKTGGYMWKYNDNK